MYLNRRGVMLVAGVSTILVVTIIGLVIWWASSSASSCTVDKNDIWESNWKLMQSSETTRDLCKETFRKTRLISYENYFEHSYRFHTEISFTSDNFLNLSIEEAKRGKNILVVNSATNFNPSFLYRNPSSDAPNKREQEIWNRTSIPYALDGTLQFVSDWVYKNQDLYPIRPDDYSARGILSTDVQVFWKTGLSDYERLDKPVAISVISIPPLSKEVDRNFFKSTSQFSDDYSNTAKNLIRLQFQAGIEAGADTLILNDFGCDSIFGNDPEDVLRYYKDVCNEYDGNFKNIIFAIEKQSNLAIFLRNLGSKLWNQS